MILIRSSGGEWRKPESSAFVDEAALQRLLAESPDLLPGVEAGSAVAIEVSVPGTGRADIAVVEASGDITIVECKLASNSEARRAVIGQIIAYAAGLTGMSYLEFADGFIDRLPNPSANSTSAIWRASSGPSRATCGKGGSG